MIMFNLVNNLIEAIIFVTYMYIILCKNKKPYLATLVTIIIYTATLSYISRDIPAIIFTLPEFIILFIYANHINEHHYNQNLFVSLSAFSLHNISITFSIIITKILYIDNIYFFTTVFSQIFFLLLVLITSFYIKKYNILYTRKLKYILFSILFLNIFYSSLADTILHNMIIDKYLLTTLISINLLSICQCIMIFKTQKEQKLLLELQKEKLLLESHQIIYNIYKTNNQELNKWKHDSKHIFNTISYQINQHDYIAALKTINKYHNQLNKESAIIETPNNLLNYILASKYSEIKQHNITLITNYKTNICPLSDSHFSIIIGNLLDNAVENCSPPEKKIFLSIENKANIYFIEVKNSIDNSILFNNPTLCTTKTDKSNHGFGLKSIYSVLKKYHGQINIFEEYNYFIVRIVIPIYKG